MAGIPLIIAAFLLMKGAPELSPPWFAGMCIALCLGAAYVVEEIVWMTRRKGRPCGRCDQMIREILQRGLDMPSLRTAA